MLTKEPEMLQPDALSEHANAMQQNATAAGPGSAQNPAGGAFGIPSHSHPLVGFNLKGAPRRGKWKGGKGQGNGGEGMGGEGKGRGG